MGGAGAIVGDGYSIAWRTYDAQYWGVPQRRRRIYLVADLRGERAGEILFEQEGVRGNPAKGVPARKTTAEDAAGSAGGSGCAGGIGAFHLQQDPICGSVAPCIGGQHQASVGVFMGGQGDKAGGIAYSENTAPTLKAANSGSNQVPDIVYPNIARTLADEHDASPCVDRGQNVIVHSAGFNDATGERAQGGMEYTEARSPTLRAGDVRAVVYDARGNGDGGVSPTLTGDHENRATDYTAITVYPKTTGALCANSHPGSYTGQDAFNDMIQVTPGKPPRKYIVRRITPLECCRLQGFPDWWTEGCETHPITMAQAKNKTIFLHVDPTGAIEGADSPKYKMWGNGIALPCALHVMQGVARVLEDVRDRCLEKQT